MAKRLPKTVAAYRHQDAQAPHTCTAAGCPPGQYYVSIRRDRFTGLLLGPYSTHGEALALVPRGRVLAEQVDPWAAFDAIGTVRTADSCSRPGMLNGLLTEETP